MRSPEEAVLPAIMPGIPVEDDHHLMFENMRSRTLAGIAALATVVTIAATAKNSRADTTPSQRSVGVPGLYDLIQQDINTSIESVPAGAEVKTITDGAIRNSIRGFIRDTVQDKVTKAHFSQDKHNLSKFKVKLTQINKRFGLGLVAFRNSSDYTDTNMVTIGRSYDSDVIADKSVVVTPMLKSHGKAKPRKFGKSVVLENWADLNIANLDKPQEQAAKDEKHIGTLNIKTLKPITKKILASGDFYIDVSQSCELRDKSYEPGCGKVFSRTFRVDKKNKSYVDGVYTKPGEVYGSYTSKKKH